MYEMKYTDAECQKNAYRWAFTWSPSWIPDASASRRFPASSRLKWHTTRKVSPLFESNPMPRGSFVTMTVNSLTERPKSSVCRVAFLLKIWPWLFDDAIVFSPLSLFLVLRCLLLASFFAFFRPALRALVFFWVTLLFDVLAPPQQQKSQKKER